MVRSYADLSGSAAAPTRSGSAAVLRAHGGPSRQPIQKMAATTSSTPKSLLSARSEQALEPDQQRGASQIPQDQRHRSATQGIRPLARNNKKVWAQTSSGTLGAGVGYATVQPSIRLLLGGTTLLERLHLLLQARHRSAPKHATNATHRRGPWDYNVAETLLNRGAGSTRCSLRREIGLAAERRPLRSANASG